MYRSDLLQRRNQEKSNVANVEGTKLITKDWNCNLIVNSLFIIRFLLKDVL